MGKFVLKNVLKGAQTYTEEGRSGFQEWHSDERKKWNLLASKVFHLFFPNLEKIQPRGGEKSAAWCAEWPRGVDSAIPQFLTPENYNKKNMWDLWEWFFL